MTPSRPEESEGARRNRLATAREYARRDRERRREAAGRAVDRDRPAQCERPYDDDESEFLAAIRAYQERTGRKFPAWSEVLAVLKGLGYRKG